MKKPTTPCSWRRDPFWQQLYIQLLALHTKGIDVRDEFSMNDLCNDVAGATDIAYKQAFLAPARIQLDELPKAICDNPFLNGDA